MSDKATEGAREAWRIGYEAIEAELARSEAEVSRLGQQLRDEQQKRERLERLLRNERVERVTERDAALALVGQLQTENQRLHGIIDDVRGRALAQAIGERNALRAEVGQLQGQLDAERSSHDLDSARLRSAEQQLARVDELHPHFTVAGVRWCSTCKAQTWPCPSITAAAVLSDREGKPNE